MSEQQGGMPPIDFDAIRRAREMVEAREEHDPEQLHDALRGLLGAYDALAARHAVLAVQQTGGFDR